VTCKYTTTKTGQRGPDAGSGQLGKNSWEWRDRKVCTGQPEKTDGKGKTEQRGQHGQNVTEWAGQLTGQLGWDSRCRTATTGCLRHENR
jgi:hypothetical protein